MKFQKTLSLTFFLLFLNVILYSQNESKYPEHPITTYNVNVGVNYTGAGKGAVAPGYVFGVDFEHHFKSNPLGINLGFRKLTLRAINERQEADFFINEFLGKYLTVFRKIPFMLMWVILMEIFISIMAIFQV